MDHESYGYQSTGEKTHGFDVEQFDEELFSGDTIGCPVDLVEKM